MIREMTLLTVAAIALAACATRENYEQSLNDWIGHKSDELASSWGPPASSEKLPGGGTVLHYDKSRERLVPTGSLFQPQTTYVKGIAANNNWQSHYGMSTGYVIGVPPARTVSECATDFTTDSSGVIVSWKADGNDCVA